MSEYIYVTELALSTNIHTQTKFKSQIVSSIRTLHLPQPRTDHLLKRSYHGSWSRLVTSAVGLAPHGK